MDSRRFDLNLLVTLEALLAEENVTKAAARLHLSQPAVSAQLNRLRDLFDDQLFVPAQRGIVPTQKAIELREPLRNALELARATVNTHRNFNPTTAEFTVVVAGTDYVQAALLGPFMAGLRLAAPGIRIALQSLQIDRLEGQMMKGEVDLALMSPEAAPGNLRSRRLFDERYVLIGRRGHPRLREDLTIAEYAEMEHAIVSLRGGEFNTPVDIALKALGYRRKVVLSAASFLMVLEIVARTDLVALVPETLTMDCADTLLVIRPPFLVEGFTVGMVWHERTNDHIDQRWFREALVNSITAGQSRRS